MKGVIEMNLKQEIEQDIELAKMMVEDIDKVFKKYAKAALNAESERTEKVKAEKYRDCINYDELHELYAYDEITIDELEAGRDFFKSREDRIKQLSFVEKHRKNIKEIRDRWKGTVIELQEELSQISGVVKDNRTYFEKLEAEENEERYKLLS